MNIATKTCPCADTAREYGKGGGARKPRVESQSPCIKVQQDSDLPLVYELGIFELCLNHDPSPSIGSDGNLGSSSSRASPESPVAAPINPNPGLLTSLNLHPSTFSLDSVYSFDCRHPGLSEGCKDLRPRLMAEFRRLFIGSLSWSFLKLPSMIMFSISSVRRSMTLSGIGGSCGSGLVGGTNEGSSSLTPWCNMLSTTVTEVSSICEGWMDQPTF